MAAKQRDLVGEFALLRQRNHSEGAAAGGVPIDRQVLGVDLSSSSSSAGREAGRAGELVASLGVVRTLTRFVSQALRLMWRLS